MFDDPDSPESNGSYTWTGESLRKWCNPRHRNQSSRCNRLECNDAASISLTTGGRSSFVSLSSTASKTNEVVTDLVNLFHQQNDRLERVEKNQEKIPMVIATHIEESKRNKNQTTPMVVDCATFTAVYRHGKSKKPPKD